MAQPNKDIIEIRKELAVLENNDTRHFSHIKDINQKIDAINKNLQTIVELMGGSELNNKKGFVSMVEKLFDKVERLTLQVEKHETKIEHGYWWGRGVALAVIGVIIKTFSGS